MYFVFIFILLIRDYDNTVRYGHGMAQYILWN